MIKIEPGQIWVHKYGLRDQSKEKIKILQKLNKNCFEIQCTYTGSKELLTSTEIKDNYIIENG